MIKWTGKVGPSNLNSDYAKPFVVYADDRSAAISKAVALSGYAPRDGKVWITSFEEQSPAALPATPEEGDRG